MTRIEKGKIYKFSVKKDNFIASTRSNSEVGGKVTFLSYAAEDWHVGMSLDLHRNFKIDINFVVGKVKYIKENCHGNYHDIVFYDDENLNLGDEQLILQLIPEVEEMILTRLLSKEEFTDEV